MPNKTYNAWVAMRQRCYNKNLKGHRHYGGRGIRVCKRWRGEDGFANFMEDMGPRPSAKHSLDRIDNDGNYTPKNCRWATRRQQQNNRRTNHFLTYKGVTKSVSQWSRATGISKNTILMRVRAGWSTSDSLRESPGAVKPSGRPPRLFYIDEKPYTAAEIAFESYWGLSTQQVLHYLSKGVPPRKVLMLLPTQTANVSRRWLLGE